jgi:hypothetical protein
MTASTVLLPRKFRSEDPTMHISRKQAVVALVAGLVPWISRRAYAQVAAVPVAPTPVAPAQEKTTWQLQIDELKKRVATLEQQLASQVAFSKDKAGNLTLKAPAGVTLSGKTLSLNCSGKADLVAGGALSLKSSGTADLLADGTLKVKGATIHLN